MSSERALLTITRLGIVCAVLALAACASSPSVTPAPSVTGAVAPVCDGPPQVSEIGPNGSMMPVEIFLTCTKAVAAATAALPVDHLPIRGVEFHFGNYCPPGSYCPIGSSEAGFVIFHTGGRGPDLWVSVAADEAGAVSVTGAVEAFPPSLGP